MRRGLFLGSCLLIGVACGGDGEEQAGQEDAALDTATALSATDTTVIVPSPPPGRRGAFVAVSGDAYDLSGSWQARAGLCEEPAMLQVVAGEPGIGAIVLLQLPPLGARTGTYPVTFADSGLPAPPAAQIGVQTLTEQAGHAFQAQSGEVEVLAFDRQVSGRVRVTLRDIALERLVGYAATFEAVPVTPLDSARCRAAQPGAGPGGDG